MKYKGKKGLLWIIILFLINSGFIWALFVDKQIFERILIFIIFILADVFCLYVTINNYVILDETSMFIIFGWEKQRINYSDICALKRTHNPISATALSLDRIEIKTNAGYYIISVQEKNDFIKRILNKNSAIQIN